MAELSGAGSAAVGPRDAVSTWRAATAGFLGSPDRAEFPHPQRRTVDSLADTLATRAGMLVMPAAEREATPASVRGYLASRPETSDGSSLSRW